MAESVHTKGWGHERWLHNDEKYCAKVLIFRAGCRCSLHYHRLKHETFLLKSGRLIMLTAPVSEVSVHSLDTSLCKLRVEVMLPNDHIDMPPFTAHQMIALDDSELIEFSTQHFDDDSVRIVKGD